MAAKIKILRASAANSTPPALEQGELAVNGLADPAELWTGVPTSRDPTGRINLLADGGVTLPLPVADGGTGATDGDEALDNLSETAGTTAGMLQRNAAGQWAVSAVVSMGTAAPSAPHIGALWFDTANLQLFIYMNDGTTSLWLPVINQPRTTIA